MRKHFGLRGAFHGYSLINDMLKGTRYRLLMVRFVLALHFCGGWRFERLVDFLSFYRTKLKIPKKILHADIPFSLN